MGAEVKPTYKAYDDEFKYAPEIEERVPEIMEEAANGPRYEQTGAQAMEEYHRLFESNTEARRQYKWENQEELKSAREGRILHMNDFMQMLRKAGVPTAYYSEKGGMRGTLGLYVNHDGIRPPCKHDPEKFDRNTGLAKYCPCHICNGHGHYVTFVQVPFMQEYEEVHFDRYDVPLGPKRRGWRTVLLNLIQSKFLTESQAHEVFGEPASGPVSRRYRHYLSYLRNLPK